VKPNFKYEILTTKGFKKFDGISKQSSSKTYTIIGETLESIVATENHKFQCSDDSWVSVLDLLTTHRNSILKNIGEIVDISPNNITEDVYDLINVADTKSFIASGFISHNCEFIGSAQTLISSNILLGLTSREPIKTQYEIKYYIEPLEGHVYIMTVDVSKGRGQDYSTFSIFDITEQPFKQVCTFRDNMISPLMFPEYIIRGAKLYNNAIVIIENNDVGQVVCNSVYYDYEYDNLFVQSSLKASGVGVTMTKRVKRVGCSNLKDLLEQGKLEVYDANTIIELTSFEPKGESYAASGSNHDDMVMNLVLFAWFVSTEAFGNISSIDLKSLLYADKIKEMEENDLPFAIMTSEYNEYSSPSMEYYEKAKAELEEWGHL